MSTATLRLDELPRAVSGRRAAGWWGMVLFLVSEAALFAYLLMSYFYVRTLAEVWPPEGIRRPDLVVASINTVVLLSSSVPMWWAERGIRNGQAAILKVGLLLSFLLGSAFLYTQLVEYELHPFSPREHVYTSLVYTITGFHGAHVAIGLLMNAYVQVRAYLGHFDRLRCVAVQNTALYWHFVDGVWVVIFTSLYLTPYLW